MGKRIKNTVNKAFGFILIFLGVIFWLTPFTPGATLLIIIGLELIGLNMLFGQEMQDWLDKNKFWKKK